jgi:hypothetical protein
VGLGVQVAVGLLVTVGVQVGIRVAVGISVGVCAVLVAGSPPLMSLVVVRITSPNPQYTTTTKAANTTRILA